MNRVEVMGGLTRDPETTFLQTGTAIWSATVAVNGARYDSKARAQVVSTVYVSLSAFGWMAEELTNADYRQGDELHVVGELDQYEKEGPDGKKDRKTRVRPLVVTCTRRKLPVSSQRPAAPAQRPVDPWFAPEPPPDDREPPF